MTRTPARIELPEAMRSRAVRQVILAFAARGAEIRFVGGCVRDAILGRPVRDIDFATPAKPDAVAAVLDAANIKHIPTGLAHGTLTAVLGPEHFEITTLREDLATDGRHATVAFTDDWAADAARRDFTMNALYCDTDGALFDPVNGLADAQAGRVRFVGEAATRIAEDHLRILRFFRFYAHFGRPPADADALAACGYAAAKIATLSAERLGREMLRLLEAADPLPALALMDGAGVLRETLREPVRLDVLPGLLALEAGEADPLRRLAAMLAGGDGVAVRLTNRLRLSKVQRRRLAAMLEPMRGATPGATDAALHEAIYRHGAALVRDVLCLAWARADESAGWRAQDDVAANWTRPTLPLAGADVLALGVEPGESVGQLLAQVEDWWTEQDFAPDRTACVAKLATLV